MPETDKHLLLKRCAFRLNVFFICPRVTFLTERSFANAGSTAGNVSAFASHSRFSDGKVAVTLFPPAAWAVALLNWFSPTVRTLDENMFER